MEIQSLRLLVTDRDLEPIAARLARQADGIEGLAVHFTPDGVAVRGQAQTPFGFKVSFETLWEVAAAGPELHVRLTALKMAGISAGLLRGALMKMVRDAVEGQAGVSVVEDVVVVRVADAAWTHGVEVAVAFTAVRMGDGACVLEAGRGG